MWISIVIPDCWNAYVGAHLMMRNNIVEVEDVKYGLLGGHRCAHESPILVRVSINGHVGGWCYPHHLSSDIICNGCMYRLPDGGT